MAEQRFSAAFDDPQDVEKRKRALRQRMHALRDAIPVQQRADSAQRLVAHADGAAMQRYLPRSGGIIAGYVAIRSEIDPLPLLTRLQHAGFQLALPAIEAGSMVFRQWRIGETLIEGKLKTREPLPEAPQLAPDLVLTPMLAFDRSHARLGYGGGYYDRYFAANPGIARIGLAYACQRVEAVPRLAHDILLQAILTEAEDMNS